MRTLLLLAAAWLLASPSRAAIAYTHFLHPLGDYALDYPSDWKRALGLQAVSLRPPGRQGDGTGVAFERYPFGQDSPKTPEAFVRELKGDVIRKVVSEKDVIVAGRKAKRLELVTTAELKGSYGEKLPGPLRQVFIVLPATADGSFYVLRLSGTGTNFDQALPEFDAIAARLVLAPAPRPH